MPDSAALTFTLPEPFAGWFAARGWQARPHQLALTEAALAGESALLIAPTGGGKTLAGFLASLIELKDKGRQSNSGIPALHTLYISPLKALAVDVQRNLMAPVGEMDLPIRIETRTAVCAAGRSNILLMPAAARKPNSPALSSQLAQLPCT